MTTSLAALLLALALPPAPQAVPSAPPVVEPYRLELPGGGFIDWYGGTVGAVGRIRIFRDIDRNKGNYDLTKSEAESKSRKLTLGALEGISIDGSARVGERKDVMDWASRRLADEEATSAGRTHGSLFEAVMELPLRGDDGALSKLLPVTNRLSPGNTLQRASATPAQGGESAPPGVTGLMVDARLLPEDAQPVPALMPRIVDADGRVVYDTEHLDLDFAREYGVITYAIGAPNGSSPPESVRPPRTGARPLIVDAAVSTGGLKSDVVVSVADADRILAAAARGTFLQECRVLVLMPPPHIKPEIVVPRRYMRPHATPRPANPNEPGRKE